MCMSVCLQYEIKGDGMPALIDKAGDALRVDHLQRRLSLTVFPMRVVISTAVRGGYS